METNALGFTQEQELVRKSEDRSHELRGIFIALIPLAIVAVMLRFGARKVARMRWWWDDWLCVVALLFAVGLNIALIYCVDGGGLGTHAEFAGKEAIVYGLKILFTCELLYQIAMAFIKISIILFYYRLFGSNARFVTAIWVMGTVVICWYLASTFTIIFQCKPISYLWDHSNPEGVCVPQESLWIGSSVSSLLTDVAVLGLPMPMIWGMRATPNQKIALTAVFLLGAFVCVTSIIRLDNINGLSLQDPSWSLVPAAIWTPVECSVAIISSCLPTLKPLFRSFFDLTDALPFDSPRKGSDEKHDAGTHANPNMGEYQRSKQWRANANAMRICELGEVQHQEVEKRDRQAGAYGVGGHVWDDEAEGKRYGRNFSRPWLGLKDSMADMRMAVKKPSDDTIVARDFSTHKPSRETMHDEGRGLDSVPKDGAVWDGRRQFEIREDSPHLWGRDGRRLRLPNFPFERQTQSIISLPSPGHLA